MIGFPASSVETELMGWAMEIHADGSAGIEEPIAEVEREF